MIKKKKPKENWSKWAFFYNLNFKKLPEISVVYQIRCTNSCSKPISTNRLGGVDKNGILDIGHTKNLKIRMTDFWRAAEGNENYSHQAGKSFWRRDLKKLFPIQALQFRYSIKRNKRTARRVEYAEIQKYIMRFCELPPLNSQT